MGITEPCFYSCNSIITEVNKVFIDFTEYELCDISVNIACLLQVLQDLYIEVLKLGRIV